MYQPNVSDIIFFIPPHLNTNLVYGGIDRHTSHIDNQPNTKPYTNGLEFLYRIFFSYTYLHHYMWMGFCLKIY